MAFYHELDETDQLQMDHIMRCVKIYPVQRGARHALRLETNGVAKSNTHKAQLWWWVFQQWKEEGVTWDAVLNLVQAVADPHEQGNPLITPAAELPQGAEPSFVVAPYAAPGAAPVVPAPVQSNQPTRHNWNRRNQGRGNQQSSASSSSSFNNAVARARRNAQSKKKKKTSEVEYPLTTFQPSRKPLKLPELSLVEFLAKHHIDTSGISSDDSSDEDEEEICRV